MEKNITSKSPATPMLPDQTTYPILALAVSMTVTALSLPLTKILSQRLELMSVDVHKESRPAIPKLGGLSILLGTLAGALLTLNLVGEPTLATAYSLTVSLAALVGLFEDFRELNPVVKPLLVAVAGAPLVLLGVYSPFPELPFIGRARLTIIYPILILAGVTVVANAVNSTDVMNGSMSLTSLASLSPLILVSILEARFEALTVGLALAGSLIVFTSQNLYPAKVFSGNVGSLVVGTSIATIAIIGRLEILALIALMPQIMNEFHIIFSSGGLRNAKNIPLRPVEVSSTVIRANPARGAPITLVRLLTSAYPLTEKQVVTRMALLTTYTGVLALITYWAFMR